MLYYDIKPYLFFVKVAKFENVICSKLGGAILGPGNSWPYRQCASVLQVNGQRLKLSLFFLS